MPMRNKDFAVFILSYGRAERVTTYEILKRVGYTGRIYFLCSTDDKDLPRYREIYGDQVIAFNKDDYKGTFDVGDNFGDNRGVVYARNANFSIAEKMGLKYYLQLDDDYMIFAYKFNQNMEYGEKIIKNFDSICDIFVDFLATSPVCSIAFGQGGDFIGGGQNSYVKDFVHSRRKLMNSFFNRVDRPYQFLGRINEDTTSYVYNGSLGKIFFTILMISLTQRTTQSNVGGLTEQYLDIGTYVKSFYSIMFCPSCVKISVMGEKFKRLHHSISWVNAVPVIIDENYKKGKL
jgi:hypothetical protein